MASEDQLPLGELENRERKVLPDFLSRVAHDIRGPAGVTWGALEELENRLGPGSPEATLLVLARRGLRRVLRISERLSMAAQLESGPLELERRPVPVARLVADAKDDAAALEGRKGVTVEIATTDDSALIDADPHWLGAAVSEIVANAIRHARRGVHVSTSASPEDVEIVVVDDGPGFSARARDSALHRFESPEGRSGLGVSLSIADEVARAHGGSLTLDQPKAGGRVVLRLPRSHGDPYADGGRGTDSMSGLPRSG